MTETSIARCAWCGNDPIYVHYHDSEWGVPNHDSQHLFEMLCLEGQQAGLSWITVLKKRECYRQQFHHFDITRVAAMNDADIERLLQDAGLIRHRGKLNAIVDNARAWQAQTARGIDMAAWLWTFVKHTPIVNNWEHYRSAPTTTAQSDAMSKALKKIGFRFVGSTTCYAFMQACGMVSDHEKRCFRTV